MQQAKNVLGTKLEVCCKSPMTGFYRDGSCNTNYQDRGKHIICAHVTQPFLAFSKMRGNDLTTPRPTLNFPGLKPGDRWCVCVLRWKEALEFGVAPPVILESTHEMALAYVSMSDLEAHAFDYQ